MADYVLYALGRGTELGYAAATLRNWLGANPIGALTDAGYNPYLAAAYRSSIIQTSGSYFTTWAAAKAGFISSVQNETDFFPGTIYAGGQSDSNANVQPLAAAVSMVADQPGGATAWSWLSTKVTPFISGDLKWAINPRTGQQTSPPPPPPPPTTVSLCDLNGDGQVNSSDVQIAINQALGVVACTNADLVGNGQCNVIDVQRVINASMGASCKVGP
jgi:hypothetical protein